MSARLFKGVGLSLALGMLLYAAAAPAQTGPRAERWERWAAHDRAATAAVDHAAWGRFLGAYVTPDADGVNRVAYGQVSGPDRTALREYLKGLSKVPVDRLNRGEQLAYWINLYNALTVRVVLDHYPVASIRDINLSLIPFVNGPWREKLITVEGKDISLDDIEHRILRPLWRDPRIHYVLNCASVGCPNLVRQAFTAENAETLMAAAARAYVNHPRGARIADGRLTVSSIYTWYREDFEGTEAGVIAHLRRHAEPALRKSLQAVTGIAGHGYDWALNDTAASEPPANN